jgi:dihydrofolate synthase/folylpolyglutamate synthase
MADFARSAHPGVQAQLDRLSKLSPAGDRLGLERIAAFSTGWTAARCVAAGPPCRRDQRQGLDRSIPPCRAGGRRSLDPCLHQPHLVRFNERIRIAGRLVDDEVLEGLLSEVLDAGKGIEPSFFEVATAVAILAFARTPADACLLEVGLGGRLDATNVIERPLVTGIANLALDHQQFLGQA